MPTMGDVVATFVRILEALFAVGMIGSALVILLTTIEDVHVMFEKDAPPTGQSPEIDQGGPQA